MISVLLEDVADITARQQKIILRDLIDNPYSSYGRLYDQIWEDNPDPPLCMGKVLAIMICRLRKRLKPGWRIECFQRGFRLVHS